MKGWKPAAGTWWPWARKTANYDNDYRWTVSCDASNPDWWQDWVTNPQVRQDGFAGDLPSLKFEEGGRHGGRIPLGGFVDAGALYGR